MISRPLRRPPGGLLPEVDEPDPKAPLAGGHHGLYLLILAAVRSCKPCFVESAHEYYIHDPGGKFWIVPLCLGDIADAISCSVRGSAVQLDTAAVGLVYAEDQLQQGCFPASIRADYADEIAVIHSKVDIFQNGFAVEGECDVAGFYNGLFLFTLFLGYANYSQFGVSAPARVMNTYGRRPCGMVDK